MNRGSGNGARSIGIAVRFTCRTTAPLAERIVVPAGMRTSRPGMRGFVRTVSLRGNVPGELTGGGVDEPGDTVTETFKEAFHAGWGDLVDRVAFGVLVEIDTAAGHAGGVGADEPRRRGAVIAGAVELQPVSSPTQNQSYSPRR